MTSMPLNPHLPFQDQAREAMASYRDVFGACIDRFGISWMVAIADSTT